MLVWLSFKAWQIRIRRNKSLLNVTRTRPLPSRKAKKLILAAFFEVGKPSLFDSKYSAPSSSASSGEALRQLVISASTSLLSILQGMRSISTALRNPNRVAVPPQTVQGGGVQRGYKTSRDYPSLLDHQSGIRFVGI